MRPFSSVLARDSHLRTACVPYDLGPRPAFQPKVDDHCVLCGTEQAVGRFGTYVPKRPTNLEQGFWKVGGAGIESVTPAL